MEGGGATSSAIIHERKKNKKKKSRRFNDEQIKSLESVFKMENKLEPRKKLEMATQLGLHPRQVAIWFQNRRARWKFKQVEQDYATLQADYHTLTHRFDSLKKEKQALLRQLRNLCSQLKEEEGISSKLDIMSACRSSENEDYHELLNGGGNYSTGFSGGPLDMAIHSDEEEDDNDDDDPIKQREMIKEEELQSKQDDDDDDDDDDNQVTNFDLGCLFDQSYNSSNWWDVWSSNS